LHDANWNVVCLALNGQSSFVRFKNDQDSGESEKCKRGGGDQPFG